MGPKMKLAYCVLMAVSQLAGGVAMVVRAANVAKKL